ncbi:MAG: glycosyltransferase family 2 protein [Smithella sp.]|nr:glycosyltransferase family 2 protein [Smithella sp.]
MPTISIIVPNLNAGATIGRALQSLVDQDYPGLEIIVIDGGSTDNSVEVIRQYQQYITWWVSENDLGQANAINKGFAKATGEIVNWLCSDDYLTQGALKIVGREFAEHPDVDIVAGACRLVYDLEPSRNRIEQPTEEKLSVMPCCNPIPQPSCFYRRALLKRRPPLNETFHYVMDFELWNYFISNGNRWRLISNVLSEYPLSGSNKITTGGVKITLEFEKVYRLYTNERIPATFWHRRLRYPLERLHRRYPNALFGFLIYYPWQCLMILILSPFYGFKRMRWMNWVEFS